jgi:hypothetical protein
MRGQQQEQVDQFSFGEESPGESAGFLDDTEQFGENTGQTPRNEGSFDDSQHPIAKVTPYVDGITATLEGEGHKVAAAITQGVFSGLAYYLKGGNNGS